MTKLGSVVYQLYCPFSTTQGVVGGMLLPSRSLLLLGFLFLSFPWYAFLPHASVGFWAALSRLRFYACAVYMSDTKHRKTQYLKPIYFRFTFSSKRKVCLYSLKSEMGCGFACVSLVGFVTFLSHFNSVFV